MVLRQWSPSPAWSWKWRSLGSVRARPLVRRLGHGAVLAFMAWFWLTTSWCAYFLARIAQGLPSSQGKMKTRTTRAITLLLATAAAVAYIASWAIFLQTGRFANWEAVRFTLFNLNMLGDYFRAADAMQFVWLGLVVSSLLVGLPLLARQLAQKNLELANPQTFRWRLYIWLALFIAMSVAQDRVYADLSAKRIFVRIDQFRNGLNPLLTLVCSTVDAWQGQAIPACLDTAELVPLSPSSLPIQPASGKQRSIIVIAVESLRADVIHLRHHGREVMPNLNRLARGGLQFTRAYAESTHSDYADVCLVSSLYPLRTRHHHYYRADDPWPKTCSTTC